MKTRGQKLGESIAYMLIVMAVLTVLVAFGKFIFWLAQV